MFLMLIIIKKNKKIKKIKIKQYWISDVECYIKYVNILQYNNVIYSIICILPALVLLMKYV